MTMNRKKPIRGDRVEITRLRGILVRTWWVVQYVSLCFHYERCRERIMW